VVPEALYSKLVEPRSHLWWWVSTPENLSLESVVEGILAFGTMEDVKELLSLVGKDRVKAIFLRQISRRRHNYRPQTVNFFSKVFSGDV
jgi:hypothetical protein